MNKTSLLTASLALVFAAAPLSAQTRQLVKKWETHTTLKTPESVLFDGPNRTLYVSNIDGREPWSKDGKGSIAKVGHDGKVIADEWVTGLNAPKGLGLHNGRLYVADVDEVVVIDVAKAAIAQRIPVSGAQQLNDITIGASGQVYVSDSATKRIHAVSGSTVSLVVEVPTRPNGLLALGDDLYILDSGTLLKFGADKKLVKLAEGMDASTDGIEQVAAGEFIVSAWRGLVYYVNAKGEKQQLLDTTSTETNSADIGYDAQTRTVYVPTFFKNSVVAYELK